MREVAQEIALLIPKLKPAERKAVREMLDAKDLEKWKADTAKFRQLIRGKAKDHRPASKIISEMRG